MVVFIIKLVNIWHELQNTQLQEMAICDFR